MARKQAAKFTSKDEDPAFPRFNHFPWEIRRMVWEQALPAPTPQVLIYKPTTFPRWDPETNDWDAKDRPPTIPIPPPALLHATQESRAFALEHVLIRKVKKARTRCVAPSAYHHVVSRPFNRDTDALFVHEAHFPSFIDVYMASTPSAARHLVFDIDIYLDHDVEWFAFSCHAARKCLGLRSVALVGLGRCDGRLDAEAAGDREPGGSYRAAPDAEAVVSREGWDQALGDGFEIVLGPGGMPWRTRLGSGRLCGAADGADDDENLLECSQVVLQRITA